MNIKIIICITLSLTACISQAQEMERKIEKNGMEVLWHQNERSITFEMSAPTNGWVTIGFNERNTTDKAYLLMGRIVNGKAQVVEHYTSSPGTYRPTEQLGEPSKISKVSGNESTGTTALKFTVALDQNSNFQKDLSKGSTYYLIMAYSRHDDFQHHSIWRQSVKITL